jgi:hypothetical protein
MQALYGVQYFRPHEQANVEARDNDLHYYKHQPEELLLRAATAGYSRLDKFR